MEPSSAAGMRQGSSSLLREDAPRRLAAAVPIESSVAIEAVNLEGAARPIGEEAFTEGSGRHCSSRESPHPVLLVEKCAAMGSQVSNPICQTSAPDVFWFESRDS